MKKKNREGKMKSVRWSKDQLSEYLKKGTAKDMPIKKAPLSDRYRNEWERDFAKNVLHIKLIRGEIDNYEYEPCAFRLAEGLKIIPDFITKLANGLFAVYEVKGFERKDWKVKWKMFKEKYWWMFDYFYLAKKVDGHWRITEG